ncbi:MAG: heparinase II/III domain-containing protein [Promethearchaeota archaeon]
MKRKGKLRPLGIILAGILVFNAMSAPYMLSVINSHSPAKGGYNREIIYIKDASGVTGGYFLMIDDIFNPASLPVDMILHGLGSLEIKDGTCNWTTASGNGVVASVLFPQNVSITSYMGYYSEVKGYIPYVKIRPPPGTTRVVTLLFPYNSSIIVPSFNVSSGGGNGVVNALVGSRDALLFHVDPWQDSYPVVEINENASFAGDYLHFHENISGCMESIFMNDGTSLVVRGASLVQAPSPVSVRVLNETLVTNASLSRDYIPPSFPSSNIDKSAISEAIQGNVHPFLFFNETTFPALLDRINTKDPWKSWYATLQGQVPLPGDRYNSNQGFYTRAGNAIKLAFVGYVENDSVLINDAKEYLLHMDEVQDVYPQHLERSVCVTDYAFAFDLVYNYAGAGEIDAITSLLYAHAKPLYDQMSSSPRNNWRVVMSDGLAMTGFMVKNVNFVWLADNEVDWYLRECTRAEGGIFEGQIYGGYTWRYGMRVVELLRRHGLRDYYTDPRLAATVNFSIQAVTPNGYYPMFEDCAYSTMTNDIMGIYASRFNETGHASLAAQMRWFNTFHANFTSTYHGIRPIIFYDYNLTAQEPAVGIDNSVVFPDSGIACFRDSLEGDATYLTISCKHYDQSHVHRDENSIEMFAFGEKVLTNPGYPGWGKPHHLNWTIFSEASNTYLFDDRGQECVKAGGIAEWLLADGFNYISCTGRDLYSEDECR